MIQLNLLNFWLLIDFCLIAADEFNSCGRQSRSRHFMDIPCLLTNDVTYCASAGTYYPWQSLIQFVNDNRSLMRRMYGETRQSVLLRRELQQMSHRGKNLARSLNSEENIYPLFGGNGDVKNKSFDVPVNVETNEGVNACPSQVEVVSPYWANSTRGDLVAILNVYPFEQFVYFEKCVSDPEQVFCRDECRCEQQFGLQRLLAFDPHNECRGIFSEWFRFPMCCVCRCYVKSKLADPLNTTLNGRDLETDAPSVDVNSNLTTSFNETK